LFKESPDFPASAASPTQALKLTAQGSVETLPTLLGMAGIKVKDPVELTAEFWETQSPQLRDFEILLRNRFDSFGSDKGSYHRYSNLYAALLFPKLEKPALRILEIGMGTNRGSVPSNMGAKGSPGASLRAWSSLNSSVVVWGLDVDEKIMFSEERIFTHTVDQLNVGTWARLPLALLSEKFDLIVDDGLHSPLANLNTLHQASSLLKPDGVLVIEDVPDRALPVWTLLEALGYENLSVRVYRLAKANCVVVGSIHSFPKNLP